jgi:neopullulanase
MRKAFFYLLMCLTVINADAFFSLASETLVTNQQPTPQVEKVEPPNWWANHSINSVRLLVRGKNFKYVEEVKSLDKSLKVSNVNVNQGGDYLFFDVAIAKNARVGKYEFEVVSEDGNAKIPFEISAPLDAKTNFQGITNDDVIYLIMPDRFADGDATNNKGVDRANPRAWHGGDFKGIASKMGYLKELGVTAIWLTPWYDNTDETTTCDKPWCPNTSYHGYGAIDYYGVENHFGTFADLRGMIETAHKNGIKVIQDQVANHVGFKHPWMKNPPLDDWFPPFQQEKFNNSVLLSPNGSQAERDNTLHGWFDFTLPDLNQDEPEVARYEIQNALWWVAATGVDGIRQDTIQYMPRPFIRDWSSAILKQYPKFYMVGEVFEEDSAQTAFFQGGKTGWDKVDTNLPSVFDFKLWRTSQEVFTGVKPARALRDVLKYDGLYGNVNNLTVMQNNHDTDRFMSLPGATLEGAMLHTAFVLSTRGIPQLYYGEEIAMTGGHDPDNRKDFPGGFAGDSVDKFTKAGRTADEQKMFEWTQKFIKLRRGNRTIKAGKTIDLFYDQDVYAFARFGNNGGDFDGSTHLIFAINNAGSEKEAKISFNPERVGFALCFKNLIEFENPYDKIVFEKNAAQLKINENKCFNTEQNSFSVKIPAKSIIGFNAYRFP